MARGAGANLWRTFKQALVDSPVSFLSGRCQHGAREILQKENCSSLSSSCFSGGEGAGNFAPGSRSLAKEKLGRGGESASRRLPDAALLKCSSSGNFSYTAAEGLLTVLCNNRPDVAVVLRSAAALTGRSHQKLVGSCGSFDNRTSSAGFTGVRKLHNSVAGRPSSSPIPSISVMRQMEERILFASRLISLPSAAAAVAGRRNLSSGSSWTDRWNKATEQLKNAINPKAKAKPKPNLIADANSHAGGAGGTSAAGLKAGVQGRPRELVSEAAKPLQRTVTRYREAVGLQIEAFWKRNYIVIVTLVGLGVCLLLWRLMFGIASTFISMSEGLAKFGFLALAASMVIVAGVGLRARFTINPDSVYRAAMRKLNTSAAVLEVMGAPLSGTDLRAYVMSGGGFRLKNLRPRLAGKRCFIIFPIRGSERRGLVSIEVKKKKGQYDFKLLAVDVPTAEADQRLYLVGDENEYKVGGGLMAELRDPIVKAMAAQQEFEDLDIEEEEEDERKTREAEIVAQEAESIEQEKKAAELEDSLAKEPVRAQDDAEKQAEDELRREESAKKIPV